MAYNSDGYIMLDFTEVDFRRTNQTIDGLFDRCVNVIGTNKFILVINANGRTPLPATCSFTNNQYVIDTVIYMFAVSSNDNLFIRRNDVPASDIIDDSSVSVDKTWSSNKIDSELDTKADSSALADYQPLLTPVSPVSIDENDNISVDLSGKQDTLTAGSGITIINNVISLDGVKKFDYVGSGSSTHTHDIPVNCHMIIGIQGYYTRTGNYDYGKIYNPIFIEDGDQFIPSALIDTTNLSQGMVLSYCAKITVDTTLNIFTISALNDRYGLNYNDATYTVYYI